MVAVGPVGHPIKTAVATHGVATPTEEEAVREEEETTLERANGAKGHQRRHGRGLWIAHGRLMQGRVRCIARRRRRGNGSSLVQLMLARGTRTQVRAAGWQGIDERRWTSGPLRLPVLQMGGQGTTRASGGPVLSSMPASLGRQVGRRRRMYSPQGVYSCRRTT